MSTEAATVKIKCDETVAPPGSGANVAIVYGDGAVALACLRRPLPLATSLALALIFSTVPFLRFGWTSRFWSVVPLLAACAVVIVLDLRTKTIPDFLTLPGIAYALLLAAFVSSPALGQALLGMAVGGGIVFAVAAISRGAVGGGDIKLMAMLGAALGWKQALVVLAFSQLAAAVILLPLLILRRGRRHDLLPVGAIISLFGAAMLLGNS